MNLIELSKYLQDETAAENYLLEEGILVDYKKCFYCNSDKLGLIRRNKIKCYECRKEWSKRKGSILESRNIKYSIFLGILKLYADGCGVNKISSELCVNIRTVVTIVSILRKLAINEYQIKPVNDFKRISIYVDRNNKIRIERDKLNTIDSNQTPVAYIKVKKIRLINKAFSFKFSLVWTTNNLANKWNPVHRFYSYLNTHIINYKGLNSRNINEYLFEIILRFNNNEKDFYQFLIEKLYNN